MGRIVRKINPFFVFQFERLENWLEEMAEKGLVLKKAGPVFMTFEESEPVKKKYRVIPETAMVRKEELEYYEEAGWHHVGRNRMQILCNDDSNATELFTDAQSYNDRAENLLHDLKIDVAAGIVLILLLLYRLIFSGMLGDGVIHSVVNDGVALTVLMHLGLIAVIALVIYEVVGTVRVVKRIRDGKILERRRDQPKKATIKKVSIIGLTLFLVLIVGLGIKNMAGDDVELLSDTEQLAKAESEISNPQTSHPLSVKIYDKKFFTELKDQIKKAAAQKTKESDEETFYPNYERWSEDMALFKKNVSEYATQEGENGAYYSADYYEAANEWIAEKYLEEEIKTWVEGKTMDEIRFDLAGADYAGLGKDEFGRWHLYIRKGNRMEFVTSSKGNTIKDKAEMFLKDLSE